MLTQTSGLAILEHKSLLLWTPDIAAYKIVIACMENKWTKGVWFYENEMFSDHNEINERSCIYWLENISGGAG